MIPTGDLIQLESPVMSHHARSAERDNVFSPLVRNRTHMNRSCSSPALARPGEEEDYANAPIRERSPSLANPYVDRKIEGALGNTRDTGSIAERLAQLDKQDYRGVELYEVETEFDISFTDKHAQAATGRLLVTSEELLVYKNSSIFKSRKNVPYFTFKLNKIAMHQYAEDNCHVMITYDWPKGQGPSNRKAPLQNNLELVSFRTKERADRVKIAMKVAIQKKMDRKALEKSKVKTEIREAQGVYLTSLRLREDEVDLSSVAIVHKHNVMKWCSGKTDDALFGMINPRRTAIEIHELLNLIEEAICSNGQDQLAYRDRDTRDNDVVSVGSSSQETTSVCSSDDESSDDLHRGTNEDQRLHEIPSAVCCLDIRATPLGHLIGFLKFYRRHMPSTGSFPLKDIEATLKEENVWIKPYQNLINSNMRMIRVLDQLPDIIERLEDVSHCRQITVSWLDRITIVHPSTKTLHLFFSSLKEKLESLDGEKRLTKECVEIMWGEVEMLGRMEEREEKEREEREREEEEKREKELERKKSEEKKREEKRKEEMKEKNREEKRKQQEMKEKREKEERKRKEERKTKEEVMKEKREREENKRKEEETREKREKEDKRRKEGEKTVRKEKKKREDRREDQRQERKETKDGMEKKVEKEKKEKEKKVEKEKKEKKGTEEKKPEERREMKEKNGKRKKEEEKERGREEKKRRIEKKRTSIPPLSESQLQAIPPDCTQMRHFLLFFKYCRSHLSSKVPSRISTAEIEAALKRQNMWRPDFHFLPNRIRLVNLFHQVPDIVERLEDIVHFEKITPHWMEKKIYGHPSPRVMQIFLHLLGEAVRSEEARNMGKSLDLDNVFEEAHRAARREGE
ncbi:hypothetical protein PROFUN_02156 [Planoprotostelium fungivorum]|uniref:Uncharacterized protein n=1 Tax=Planoprotostelium fungivorum TaxID=1890364 RepID=A0A2P6NZA4_9EUKA|nr:hypothetical protein PROFUN_02156 [Planoprotostelium fungivorum]